MPSEVINARHHANEVASTNASFMLLKKLLTEDVYKELPDKLNLILIPMENVDGAAIHYELQKEHPTWKFHVARFNSLGKRVLPSLFPAGYDSQRSDGNQPDLREICTGYDGG
ncbi:MAG: M14 family zinc carboxypeptidase [Fusicatenibacter saccharivorans]